MKSKQDFSVKCWSYPEEKIHYLDKGVVNIEITNNANSLIEIKKIILKFKTEEGLEPYNPNYSGPKVSIKPHHVHSRLEIPFIAELTLTEQTNSYTLEVAYTKNK